SNGPKLGVKAEELAWSGLEEQLAMSEGKISRDLVMAYLRQNGVRVEEKILGDSVRPSRLTEEESREHMALSEQAEYTTQQLRRLDELSKRISEDSRPTTQYEAHQLPGGKNYRELLLTLPHGAPPSEPRVEKVDGRWVSPDMPGAELDGRYDQRSAENHFGNLSRFDKRREGLFKAPHFGEQHGTNLLAHVRFNERTDANGKKVLFIEELQSDWAQKGRREGFTNDKQADQQAAYNKYVAEGVPESEALRRASDEFKSGPTPPAPFVGKTEAWVALALKRMIRYAADNGFDRVAWTTGEQQAERYDLSKQVSQITVFPARDEGYRVVAMKGVERVIDKDAADDAGLASLIGKELS